METIANKFNEFFVEIGPKLSQSIKDIPGKSFKQYMPQPVRIRFSFELIDETSAMKFISSLRSKSSSGIDGISTNLLKRIAPQILKPLTLIINQSLTEDRKGLSIT